MHLLSISDVTMSREWTLSMEVEATAVTAAEAGPTLMSGGKAASLI